MKLTKKQIEEITKHDWDIISNKKGNVQVLKLYKEDGKVFQEICEVFRLGAENSIEIAVIATKEDNL